MPAAVPIGIAAASAIGKFASQKSQQNAENKRIAEANRISDEDYARQLDYQKLLSGLLGGVDGTPFSNLLTNPLTSTSQSSSSYSSSSTPTFTAEGQSALNSMLNNAMNEQARAESLPEFAGLEESMARDYGQQMSGLKTSLANRAAVTGAGTQQADLDAVLAGRGITNNFLNNKQNVPMMKEQARIGKGNIANMLFGQIAQLGRGTKTRGSQSSTQSGSQDQGPGSILGYLKMLQPPEKTVYV